MEDTKKWMYIIGAIIFTIFQVYRCEVRAKNKASKASTSKPKEKISCMVCSKDLTDDYNRIAPNGNGNYYCTPCYQATMRDIHEDMKAEGYN